MNLIIKDTLWVQRSVKINEADKKKMVSILKSRKPKRVGTRRCRGGSKLRI